MTDQPTDDQVVYEPEDESRPTGTTERRSRIRRSDGGWIFGLVLIAMGLAFLLQNQGIFFLRNWWALFILIPAFGSLSEAWRAYQDSGTFNNKVRSSLFFGLIMVLVTAIFLFNLSWSLLGPVIIIMVGLGILLNALVKREEA